MSIYISSDLQWKGLEGKQLSKAVVLENLTLLIPKTNLKFNTEILVIENCSKEFINKFLIESIFPNVLENGHLIIGSDIDRHILYRIKEKVRLYCLKCYEKKITQYAPYYKMVEEEEYGRLQVLSRNDFNTMVSKYKPKIVHVSY